jgi:hypothetical protein
MPEAVDGATRVHFRVPPLREVVLRYLLTPSTNQLCFLAPTPAMTAAPVQQATTLEDRFQLPLQDGTLTPADAALFARLAPAAVSTPWRHAFHAPRYRALAPACFYPLLQLCYPSRNRLSARSRLAMGPETQLRVSSTSSRRVWGAVRPREIFLVLHMQPQLGRGLARRSSCLRRSGIRG